MRLDSKFRIAIVGLALLVISALPASAYNYAVGSGWEMFTTWADVPGPVGGFGGTTPDGSAPFNEPYTFTLFAPGFLKVTDVFESGDFFNIYNFGALLATTPAKPWAFGPITGDPNVAYGHPDLSWAIVDLAPGSYSLQFQNVLFAGGDTSVPPGPDLVADAYFRVDPVPEPATLVLLGLGLGVTGLALRRRSRSN